jgi:hypothetical protein
MQGYKMKKILISLAVCILFSSCSENLSPDIGTEENLIISSNIENISNFNNYNKIYCYYNKLPDSIALIDDSYILPNGDFNLFIPPHSASQLRTFSPYNYNSGGTVFIDSINFNKDSVLFADIKFRASNPDNVHLFVNNLNLDNSVNLNVGDFAISYYYFSEPCKINGYYKREYAQADTIVTKYDLEVKRGWNKIVTILIRNYSTYNGYVEWEVSNSYKNKDQWEIMDFPNFGQKLL